MTRQINQIVSFWKICLLFPFIFIVRLWTSSLRVQISQEDRLLLKDYEKPIVFAFWHNRLFVAHELHRRFRKRKIYGLISASKDGAWLAAIFKLLGIGAVRGSSSWRGKEAFKELIRVIEQGNDVAITPDGPRGPRYVFKRGVLELAQQTQAKHLFAEINFSSYWELNSWDGFIIPKPFSKLTVKFITSQSPLYPCCDE